MLVLGKPKTALWLDMPHGVRLHVRPYDAVVVEAMRIKATKTVAALMREKDAAADLGLMGTGHDLTDPVIQEALGCTLVVCGMAEAAIIAWDGVGDESGAALPLSPQAIRHLMLLPGMGDAFVQAYHAAYAVINEAAEGNG
jgi:hypothetical protein